MFNKSFAKVTTLFKSPPLLLIRPLQANGHFPVDALPLIMQSAVKRCQSALNFDPPQVVVFSYLSSF